MTLVLACVFAAGWIRSSLVYDHRIWAEAGQKTLIYSLDGELGWMCWTEHRVQRISYNGIALGPDDEIKWRMFQDMIRGTRDTQEWITSYWSTVIPLTLLSAYLLLSKPRPQPKQSVNHA